MVSLVTKLENSTTTGDMNYQDYQTQDKTSKVERLSQLVFLGWITTILTLIITSICQS